MPKQDKAHLIIYFLYQNMPANLSYFELENVEIEVQYLPDILLKMPKKYTRKGRKGGMVWFF